ncbi:MAG TPA: ABC transporter substrate-binding protein [Beijerinckiaceae bacterium]|jgi:NitT/TauT family transport system substrate-binding protein
MPFGTLHRRNLLALMGASALAGLGPSGALGQQKTVRLGVLRLASAGAVFIAFEKGYFRDEGLSVELKFFDAAQPIAVAVTSGDVDLGVTAFTGGLFNLAGKGQMKIVAAQSREEPGYPLIAYLASKKAHEAGFRTLADFRGKTVGITQIGSSFHYSMALLAKKLGFPLSEVRLQPLQSLSNVASALVGGAVQGALLPATVSQPLVDRGEAVRLGFVGDETPWQLGALFAATKFLGSDRDAIARFVRAYQKGCRDYHDVLLKKGPDGSLRHGPEAEALLAMISKHVNQPVDVVGKSLAFVEPEGRLLLDSVADQLEFYQSQGMVDKGFAVKDIVDTSFVPPIG